MSQAATSQVEVTDAVRDFAKDVQDEGIDFLKHAADKVRDSIALCRYDDKTKAHEASIRWRRTATQILSDGYVYEGKSCTDDVIVFIAVCRARGYETRFVKLTSGEFVHSVAEVKLDDGWYVVDVDGNMGIFKGEFGNGVERSGYRLWKKGRDAWDIGLVGIESTMDGKVID